MNKNRLFLSLIAGSTLAMAMLTQCREKTSVSQQPVPTQQSIFKGPLAKELHFNLDSMADDSPHPTARALRQLAIYHALSRLKNVRDTEKGNIDGHPIPAEALDPNAPITEGIGGGPKITYPNFAAYKADVEHDIDSLKVLEGIPLTPH